MRAGELLERHAGDRRLPGLPQRRDAGRDAAGMRHDPAARGMDHVDRADRRIGVGRLPHGLPGREHRHHLQRVGVIGKQRSEAGARRGDHRFVRFRELVAQPVDVDVVSACKPMDLVPGLELEAQSRAAAEEAPAVAVAVDRECRVAAQPRDAGGADPVEADHDAGAALAGDEIVPREHLVDLAGDVEGEHGPPAGSPGVPADHRHHRLDALREGAVGRIAHEFVVLDEVDAALHELVDEFRGLRRGEPDARLDDGADQRPAVDAGERARAGDAELRARVGPEQRGGKVEVEEAEPGDLATLEEIARDRGHDVRDRRAGVCERPGDRHLGAAEAALGRPSMSVSMR
ncbi:MAG: hypothetical protein K0R41_4641 [Geminicoccaceae bacterium]|nr:hypothetical protein [Geminicoccaceae bacterium]